MSVGGPGLAVEHLRPDEDAVVAEFIDFLKRASERRHPTGVVQRFNQPRHTGCVQAELTVPEGLDDELRAGLFATPRTYPAFVRFANASSGTDRDPDIRGMSVRVENVPGDNLTPGDTSQHFVLNSHPVMVAPDTREFLDLLQAVEAGGFRRVWYFLTHVRAARIGFSARQRPTCHLDIPYWSTTPYLFGEGQAVKYLARPTSERVSPMPRPPTDGYLRENMKRHLAEADASFDVMVQFQTDPRTMPIEDASVEWDSDASPFRRVATLRIPRQDFDTTDRMAECESVSFNPWCCLPEHRPLGDMNRARRRIYSELARFRTERNVAVS